MLLVTLQTTRWLERQPGLRASGTELSEALTREKFLQGGVFAAPRAQTFLTSIDGETLGSLGIANWLVLLSL